MNEQNQRERRLMHRFLRVSRLHHMLSECKISELGLHRSQHHMLVSVKHSGGMCQKDLAQRLEISPAAVAVTLKKLEAAGYVKRCSSSDDSRMNTIELTDEGNKLLDRTREYFSYIDRITFEDFTEEEMEMFEVLTSKMKNSLKKALEREEQKGE